MDNKKSWHCIAWHLGSFIDDAKEEKKADFAKPCETCKYNNDCNFDMMSSFKIIERKSGVKFSLCRGVSLKTINP